ncbi:polyprenyl synthetase family protein [Bacillus sp. FJAT-22090]|uniref:polyprenyl synthetase family protein n=1 Tax=Bacillus sp. FJAT-22090 TaxID=1581038 RepID=UPI00119D101F|nr:polyprenyl synthetase family protein [Bacillus sp. FJAT-22090]
MKNNHFTDSMIEIIAENIQQQDLKELLIKFVQKNSKKNYLFGELCIFHYSHFAVSFDEEILRIAAAIELLVLSFDILDDLEDEDTENKVWNRNPALSLNGATALLFLSMTAIRKTKFKHKEKAISLMEQFSLCSIEGQHMDLLNICQEEKTYIEMMEDKSGSLVSLACLVGCVIANADLPKEVVDYSRCIGIIGQINNDLADLKNWNGKNDIVNKKYSLPIIYLLDMEKNNEQVLTKYYQNKMPKEQFLEHKHVIQQKLIDADAMKYALVIKNLYQKKVMNALLKMDFSDNQLETIQKYMK